MGYLLTLITTTTSILVAASFLWAPCASHKLYVRKSLQQVDHAELTRGTLNFHEDQTMKSCADEDCTPPNKKFEQPLSDTKQDLKEKRVTNEKGRVSEEKEGPKKSEYFTMDYGWVRKRRPIHNKQIPFLP